MSAEWKSTGAGLKIGWLPAACCLLVVLAGCPIGGSNRNGGSGGALPKKVDLKLLVVDDPALATAVERLAGEWNAQTGSSFQIDQITQQELAGRDTVAADAVICPSCQLGELAENVGVVRVPDSLLEDELVNWPDVFSLLRVRETVWGKAVVGVPLGSPVFVVYYRADLLEHLGRQPPQTWAEYQELAELLSDRDNLGAAAPRADLPWHGTLEPLGPGWAGLVLLARAAPYAVHRENYSTVFSVDEMEPLIAGSPFVRALEELVAACASGPKEQLGYDPTAVRNAFWEGRCGLALTWPTAAKDFAPPGGDLPVGLAELPGSGEAYDVGEKAWEPRRKDEDPHVPLLGVAGRMGLVVGHSKWPDAAFQLLFWLCGEQSTQLSPSSPATTLFRSSHLQSAGAWVEKQMPDATAAQYAEMTQQTLCRPQWLFAVRVPGRLEYLAALDEAVHRAVKGEQKPEESLRQAAATWREITTRLGTESQREAYWNSLGID